MPVRPMLLHRMGLISFRLFCKNLGYLQEFFGQMVNPPPPDRKLPVRLCVKCKKMAYKRYMHIYTLFKEILRR